MSGRRLLRLSLAVLPLAALPAACDDMTDQPKQGVYTEKAGSPAASPAGTVTFEDHPAVPPPVDLALLRRGQEEFRTFCTPCHSELGHGHGMIVQRGFPAPPSYHIDRLRRAPPQHFYDVITNGYGMMYSFAARVSPRDRWAIVAYIKALQASQDAPLAAAPAEAQARLDREDPTP